VGLYRALKEGSAYSTQQNLHEMLKRIVTIAYDLIQSNEFKTVVGSLHASNKNAATLSDSIVKLGQYYRATRQLVLAARRTKYRVFHRIKVQAFQTEVPNAIKVRSKPGASIPLIKTLSRRPEIPKLLQQFQGSEAKADLALIHRLNNTRSGIKVHAEIKLLFFYEIHPGIRRPRIIAANKSSCYLCDLFFRLHGLFQLPSTFGMLNERWILPDWCTVAPGRAEHLKGTLIEFDSVLDSQLASVLHQRQRQPDPMQSLVALSAPWSNSQDTIKPDSIASVNPPSIISDTSGFLPFIEDTILTPGKHICSKLSGPESSLIVHFYESHVVLSSAESIENIKDCRASANRVRVSLMALQDQPAREELGQYNKIERDERGCRAITRERINTARNSVAYHLELSGGSYFDL
jgi:hypothetical protein